MKRGFLSTLVICLWSASALAQSPSPPVDANTKDAGSSAQAAAPPSPISELAAGSVLSVELSKSLDTKKAKANDKVEARTTVDYLSQGRIVVPRNTKIFGHVTEAKAHSKSSPDSKLGITFDRLLLKDGPEVPLQLAVQAIARPLQMGPIGTDPESMADASAMAGRLPPAGAQGPSGGYSPTPISPGYPANMPDPASPNTPSVLTSTVSPLGPTSRGVVGIKGLALTTSGAVSVLSSDSGNVHLDGGTQLMLRVQ